MKTEYRHPEDFGALDCTDTIISNFDGYVNSNVADKIKNKPLSASFAGWNFNGTVWWMDNSWHCEVYCYGSYNGTFSSPDLEELRIEVCDNFGYD